MRYIVGCRQVKEYNRPGHRWDKPSVVTGTHKTDRDNLLSDWWFFQYDDHQLYDRILTNTTSKSDCSIYHVTNRTRLYGFKTLTEAQIISEFLENDVKNRVIYMITEGGTTTYEIGIFEVNENKGSVVQHFDSKDRYLGHVNIKNCIIRNGKFDPKPKVWTSEELVKLVTQNIKSENGMYSTSVVADLISRLSISQLKTWLKDHNVSFKE